MPGKAAKVIITERQQQILNEFSRSRSGPYFLRQRSTIILLAFSGLLNEQIAPQVDLERHQVGLWRTRWAEAFDRLILVECLEDLAALRNVRFARALWMEQNDTGCRCGQAVVDGRPACAAIRGTEQTGNRRGESHIRLCGVNRQTVRSIYSLRKCNWFPMIGAIG